MKKIIFTIVKVVLFIVILVVSFVAKEIDKQEKRERIRTEYLSGYYDNATVKNGRVVPNKQEAYIPPTTWKNYEIRDAFTLSVPNTVELRKEDDVYTQVEKNTDWYGYKIDLNMIVFQQKGLSVMDPEAFKTYCRIIIDYQQGESGAFYKATEYENLSAEDIHYLQESTVQGIKGSGFEAIGTPEVRWVRIEDIYALEVACKRTGTEGNSTQVYRYFLFNNDENVLITLSYREKDAEIWKKDFENIIRTFRWNKIK